MSLSARSAASSPLRRQAAIARRSWSASPPLKPAATIASCITCSWKIGTPSVRSSTPLDLLLAGVGDGLEPALGAGRDGPCRPGSARGARSRPRSPGRRSVRGFSRGSIDICARDSTWNTPTLSARAASRRCRVLGGMVAHVSSTPRQARHQREARRMRTACRARGCRPSAAPAPRGRPCPTGSRCARASRRSRPAPASRWGCA
jgi:hypothetical protein